MTTLLSEDTLLRLNARSVVPEASKLPSVSATNLVQRRFKVKTTPVNGTTFKAGETIRFRISNNSAYVIPSSMKLHMRILGNTHVA